MTAFLPADHANKELSDARAKIELLEKTIAIQVKEIDRLTLAVQHERLLAEGQLMAKIVTTQKDTPRK